MISTFGFWELRLTQELAWLILDNKAVLTRWQIA